MMDEAGRQDEDDEAQLDFEIAALMEGQLDPARRYAVADHLARHPERAARAMADLRLSEGLRLALAAPDSAAPPALAAAALRLERGVARGRRIRRLLPAAAAVGAFGLGWLGHGHLVAPGNGRLWVPPVVEAALDAQSALDVRLRMASQPETRELDAAEIAAALGLRMPDLPPDWQVQDVQVVATPDRPAVAIVLDTPDMGQVMLFSVVKDEGEWLNPPGEPLDAFDYRGRTLAVFERGNAAYVLVDSSGHPAEISRGADRLMRRFN